MSAQEREHVHTVARERFLAAIGGTLSPEQAHDLARELKDEDLFTTGETWDVEGPHE